MHGGLHARLQHLQRLRLVVQFGQAARDHQALREHRVGHYCAQIAQIGLYSRQTRGGQGGLELGHGIGAVDAGDDEFGDHRVVMGRHVATGGNPGLNARIFWKHHFRQTACAGLEVACRVFGIQPHLNRRTLWRGHMQGKIIAARQAHHPGDQIDACHLLGHAVLHLQAGVDLQKVESAGIGIQYIFHCASRAVVHGFGQTHCGLLQRDSSRIRKAGCRGFFNHLLVAALGRAVAFTQRHHLATAIAEQLHLNVACPLDKLFQEQAPVLEIGLRQPLHGLERRFHLRIAAN